MAALANACWRVAATAGKGPRRQEQLQAHTAATRRRRVADAVLGYYSLKHARRPRTTILVILLLARVRNVSFLAFLNEGTRVRLLL